MLHRFRLVSGFDFGIRTKSNKIVIYILDLKTHFKFSQKNIDFLNALFSSFVLKIEI